MSERSEKAKSHIKELAATYIEGESNQTSMITVTNVEVTEDLKYATIYVSVFPSEKEDFALNFLKRKRRAMRDYIKKRINTAVIPFLEVKLDLGEKNRQRIDQLLRGEE